MGFQKHCSRSKKLIPPVCEPCMTTATSDTSITVTVINRTGPVEDSAALDGLVKENPFSLKCRAPHVSSYSLFSEQLESI